MEKSSGAVFKRTVRPGHILKEKLLKMDIIPSNFAHQIDVPANRNSQITAPKRTATGDATLRFGHWCGVHPHFRLNLLDEFDPSKVANNSRVVGLALPTSTVSR